MRAILVPLLMAAVALSVSCAGRQPVEVSLIGISPVQSTLLEQRLRLDFRLQNFSERVIRATGFQIALEVNGRQLARGVDDEPFQLTALGEERVSAVVSTSIFEVARQLLDLPGRERFSYELSGRLYLEGWPRSVSFTRAGQLTRDDLRRLVGAGGREPQPLTL